MPPCIIAHHAHAGACLHHGPALLGHVLHHVAHRCLRLRRRLEQVPELKAGLSLGLVRRSARMVLQVIARRLGESRADEGDQAIVASEAVFMANSLAGW